MAPSVRQMEARDVVAVYELGLEYFDPERIAYGFWSMSEIAQHLDHEPDLSFVAEDDGQVVGFALAAESYGLVSDVAHLAWIALAPEYHQHGIGSQLFDAVLQQLSILGKRELVADIAAENAATLSIARGFDFEHTASILLLTRPVDLPLRPSKD